MAPVQRYGFGSQSLEGLTEPGWHDIVTMFTNRETEKTPTGDT